MIGSTIHATRIAGHCLAMLYLFGAYRCQGEPAACVRRHPSRGWHFTCRPTKTHMYIKRRSGCTPGNRRGHFAKNIHVSFGLEVFPLSKGATGRCAMCNMHTGRSHPRRLPWSSRRLGCGLQEGVLCIICTLAGRILAILCFCL